MLPFDDDLKGSSIIENNLFTSGNVMTTNQIATNIPYSDGKVLFYPIPFGPATRYYTEKLGGKIFLMFAEITGPITFSVTHDFALN